MEERNKLVLGAAAMLKEDHGVVDLAAAHQMAQADISFVHRNSSIFRSFLPSCISSQFSSVCTVKMQTKTGLK